MSEEHLEDEDMARHGGQPVIIMLHALIQTSDCLEAVMSSKQHVKFKRWK